MSFTKKEALAAIDALPEDMDLGKIIERLQQIHRVQRGVLRLREQDDDGTLGDLDEPPDMIQQLIKDPLPVTGPWLTRDAVYER